MTRVLAAGLNFLVWGGGYLYRGERTVVGALLLIGYLLIHGYWVAVVGVRPALADAGALVVLAGHLFLSAGLAYDVYTDPIPGGV